MNKLTQQDCDTIYPIIEKVYGKDAMQGLANARNMDVDSPGFREWVVSYIVDAGDELLEDNDVD